MLQSNTPRTQRLSGAMTLTLGGLLFAYASQASDTLPLSSLDGSNGFRLDGVASNEYSGRAVSAIGDINGDGYDDLIIGANGASPNGLASGSSYVVFGRADGFALSMELSSLDGSNGFRLDGIATGNESGFAVSAAGDINGDGIDDLIIGAPGANESYVVFGRIEGFPAVLDLSSLDGNNGFRLAGIAAGDEAGFAVSTAGDINGDGIGDLIIGAPGANQSYVVFGRIEGFPAVLDLSSLDGNNGFRLAGVAKGDRSGSAVSNAGDINGDGIDDLIVGAPLASPHGKHAGSSYVLFGRSKGGFDPVINLSSLDGSNGFRLDGVAAGELSGFAVSNAGDINNDGIDDLIIAAPYAAADDDTVLSGRSYVVFGRSGGDFDAVFELSSLDGSNGFRVDGAAAFDYSGSAVSAASDINGDGIDDLIIGAVSYNPHLFRPGSSHVVFGRNGDFAPVIALSSIEGSMGFRIDGVTPGDQSGFAVSAAGDINGDGLGDLIIGAPHAAPNGSRSGSSYVVFGSDSIFEEGFEGG